MKLITHYDYNLLKTFFHFSMMRNKKGKSRKTTFWVFSTVGLIGSALFMFVGTNRVMFGILAGLILMIDIFVGYQLLTITKRAQKRQPAMFEAVNEYEFEAKQVIVRSLVDGAEDIHVKYDELLRAVETPTAFYLYLSPGSAFIVSKREMTEDEGEKLATLLSKKCSSGLVTVRIRRKQMKTVIASDLHGSSTYAEKVLAFASEQNADLLVLLGDHFYHGPRNPLPQGYAPMEVARLITEYQGKIVLLQGNCDAEIDEMISPYPLTPHFALFTGGKSIFFTHGHRYNKENPPKGYDILINGHFHTAKIETEKGVIYANPGSPSHPKENTVRGVLVLTDHTLSLYTLEGEERESVSW